MQCLIRSINSAVGKERKLCRLTNKTSADQNHIAENGEIEVSQLTLDSIILPEINVKNKIVLKIDVEGHEREVPLGALIILQKVGLVLLESSPGTRDECFRLLAAAGFYLNTQTFNGSISNSVWICSSIDCQST